MKKFADSDFSDLDAFVASECGKYSQELESKKKNIFLYKEDLISYRIFLDYQYISSANSVYMWDSDPDSGNLNNGDFGHEWNYTYAGKISINSDSNVFVC